MGAILLTLGAFVLLLIIGAILGAVIGFPTLVRNVKETRRIQAEQAAARKAGKP